MGILIYNILFPLVFLFFIPGLLVKLRRRGGWKSTFSERFGYYGKRVEELKKFRHAIWIHAVSVGETSVAISLIRHYHRLYPDSRFILSTTTTTGQDRARSQVGAETSVIFCPLDFIWIVKHAFNVLQPSKLVIIETEIWPNMILEAKKRDIPVFLVNARMSDHSARGYRYLSWVFFGKLLKNFDGILTQSAADSERYLAVSPDAAVVTTGNMKFDQTLPSFDEHNILADYFGADNDLMVLCAASTHPGEEKLILIVYNALLQEFPALRLVLVPRHAERGNEITELLKKSELSYARRSSQPAVPVPVQVLLVDTTGELLNIMHNSDIILMGKSFAGQHEGHNLIEPALLKKAIITGPELSNFRYLFQCLKDNHAIEVSDDALLQTMIARLLREPEIRQQLGTAAYNTIMKNRGAVERTVKFIAGEGETENKA